MNMKLLLCHVFVPMVPRIAGKLDLARWVTCWPIHVSSLGTLAHALPLATSNNVLLLSPMVS